MLPSSTSSSSQSSMGPGGGLMRYGSAPGSLLTTAVDSVIGATREFANSLGPPQTQIGPARFFHSEASEPASRPKNQEPTKANTATGLQRSYEFPGGGGDGGASSSSSLVRHSSSPAGFLNRLAATAAADNGFSITRGIGSSFNSNDGGSISRLNSQLSFTRPKETLSRISEETDQNVAVMDNNNNVQRKNTHSYASAAGFGIGSWDEANTHTFSVQPAKRLKSTTHLVNDFDAIESQFQFGMPLEMSAMDKLLNIPHDSVPCKIRAKRGCATHPRSIAERERRTRISGKLKKLQDLVPNMDKQTSYADMLDLAVQHIKTLQNQVQKLKTDLNDCTCGCQKSTDS